jgi:hypothetical protein
MIILVRIMLAGDVTLMEGVTNASGYLFGTLEGRVLLEILA